MDEFPILFSPLTIGPITLKNRIVNAPHQTGFARHGEYTDKLVEYHRERARGGAAMIVSQATSVVPDYIDLHSTDALIPQYERVSQAVREHGAHYGAELYHPGSQGEYTGPDTDIFVSPSPIVASYYHAGWRVPHALTDDEILAIVDDFGQAARRCRDGGLSSVELHFAHGNLVEQFISPRTNLRDDDWGGPLENRLRFAELILQAVRKAVGPDVAVGARMTAAGLDPGELNDMDMMEVIGTVGSWDLLDYVSLTMGHYSDALNTARNIPNMTFKPGLWQRYGKAVRNVVDVPVFLVGRINHPRTAEEILESGACDAVTMVRALIADPFLPEKSRTGRVDEIRPCIGAMNCLHHLDKGEEIRCIHNPSVGRELTLPDDVGVAERQRRIVVVGAGPAGLEYARVAACRGHEVVVIEAANRVGGQVRAAATAPTRSELSSIVEWLHQQCVDAKVDIRTGQRATVQDVIALEPDAVVLATGSRLAANPFAGGPLPVADPLTAFTPDAPSGRVAIYDELGDWQGISVTHALAERGCETIYLTPTAFPGSALEYTNWRIEYQKLTEVGVQFHPVTEAVGTEERTLLVRPGFARKVERITDLDHLVWVGAPSSEESLALQLREAGLTVDVVGDAYSPRGIEQSVFDGRRAAMHA